MNNKLNKVVIATGGTGGHVFPAYSLAKHLINKKIETELFSDQRGLGFLTNLKDIKKTKILSSPIKKDPLNLFKSFILIISGILKSFFVLISKKPDIVFGMGGYSSFPVCVASYLLNIPIIIYENNLVLGKTNKLLLPFAKKILVSTNNTAGIHKKYFNKIFVCGYLLRKEIFQIKNNYLKKNTDKLSILIIGGSQSAKVFGEKITEIIVQCSKANINFNIYQQCQKEQMLKIKCLYDKHKVSHKLFSFSEIHQELYSS